MRLKRVERGHRLPQKLMIGLLRLMIGTRVPDIIRTMLYRPEFFGEPCSEWIQAALRGPSEWSVGERELFAAFTSGVNRCRYCIGDHSGVASKALGEEALVQAALTDWRTAPLRPETRAMLGFLEKLSLAPATIEASDVAALRAAGLSHAAIEDGMQISAAFHIVNRLADALGFEVPGPASFTQHAQFLLKWGYSMRPPWSSR